MEHEHVVYAKEKRREGRKTACRYGREGIS